MYRYSVFRMVERQRWVNGVTCALAFRPLYTIAHTAMSLRVKHDTSLIHRSNAMCHIILAFTTDSPIHGRTIGAATLLHLVPPNVKSPRAPECQTPSHPILCPLDSWMTMYSSWEDGLKCGISGNRKFQITDRIESFCLLMMTTRFEDCLGVEMFLD